MAIKRAIRSSANAQQAPTFREVVREFEKEKIADGVTSKTIHNYEQSLDKFLNFANCDYNSEITALDKAAVIDWVAAMQKSNISVASINHYLRDVRAFANWCMADEQKYLTPFKITTVKGQAARPKAFVGDDLSILLQKPQNKSDNDFVEWRNWAVVNLAFDMGARAGTIVDIQMGDINLRNNTLYLRHTKNKRLTHLNFSSTCAKALKEYINLYRQGATEDEYLFCNFGGEQLTYNALAHSFAKYCKNRGVEQHNLHGLRHSFATTFAQTTNGDMVRLQKALGHSSIDMAQKYVDIASVNMGNYDEISPLAIAKSSNKGAPKRAIGRAS